MTIQVRPVAGPPPVDEISRRVAKVQAGISEMGLDYYLCHDPDNIFYLTNFANFVHERPFILLVPSTGRPVFLMPKLEEPHVRTRAVGEFDYLPYLEFPAPEGQQWSDGLRTVLEPQHKVGVESMCPLAIAGAVPGETTATDIVAEIRMIKSDFEIGRIAYTCELLCKGHALLLAGARPGRMIVELYTQISKTLTRKMLLDNPNSNMLNSKFAAIAQPPSISHDPHNFTDVFTAFSQAGPHVSLASGLANGYGGEVERTFFLNTVPEAARAPFDDMLAGRALAYELTRPGNAMSEVDRKVNAFFRSKGYGANLLHRTGHSFGVTNHEAPFLAEGYEGEIQPGMVFSIEPGIYIEGVGGFRFSDTVVVTPQGNQTLTHAPDTLEALTLKAKASLVDAAKTRLMKLFAKRASK